MSVTIPAGFHTVCPYFVVENAERFIAFLVDGLGGQEIGRTLGDQRIQHAQVKIGDSIVMVSEATERCPAMCSSFYLYVANADDSMKRAIEHGATLEMAVADMPYGDRQGGVRDPHGNIWWISQRLTTEPYTF